MKVHSGYLDNVLLPVDPRRCPFFLLQPLSLSFSLDNDDDILYDCRTIDLKRYESACLFFYAKST